MTTVNYFWIGETISQMELLAFSACKKNGHQPVIWTYDSIQNLPDFVRMESASQLLDESLYLYYRYELKMPMANISDIFRYELLHQVGGIYSDTDVVIIRSLDNISLPNYFCSTYEYVYNECANGCFMKLEAGSPITTYLIQECKTRIAEIQRVGIDHVDYCFVGPFLIQECAKIMDVPILPFDYFNPISWRFVNKLIAFEKPDYKFQLKNMLRGIVPGIEKRGYFLTKNSTAIHLCNEVWKKHGIDKNRELHTSSLYERLKKRYI